MNTTSESGVGKRRLATAILAALSLALPATWWLAGGVMVVATNRSSSLIEHLSIGYGQGVAQLGELPAGATKSQRLGRLGEGATFSVDLEQGGERRNYRAEVYFMELWFFRTNVFVEVDNDRGVTFRSGDFATKAIASRK